MKTLKFSRSNSDTITLRIPIDEVLAAFMTPEERAVVAGYKVDAWSTKSDEDSDDDREDVLDISFAKYTNYVRDETGAFVEEPKKKGGCCITKSEAEKMIEAALAKRAGP